jgi:hypothetical protein
LRVPNRLLATDGSAAGAKKVKEENQYQQAQSCPLIKELTEPKK